MLNLCLISVSSCDDINIRLLLQGRIHDSGTGVTYIGNGEQALKYVSNRKGKWKFKFDTLLKFDILEFYLSLQSYNSCRRLTETKRHSSLFLR
jgi:hypothetical protein